MTYGFYFCLILNGNKNAKKKVSFEALKKLGK